jgi:hypothetical protein
VACLLPYREASHLASLFSSSTEERDRREREIKNLGRRKMKDERKHIRRRKISALASRRHS